MNEINLQDETLNINATASYLLSMQAGIEGFTYCILDTTRNKFIAIRQKPFNFEEFNSENFIKEIVSILDSDEYLSCKYKSVRFIFNTLKYTLVPEQLYDKDEAKLFFQLNHNLNENEVLHTNRLKNADSFTIFSLPYSLVEAIYMRFPNSKLYHSSAPFIDPNLIKYRIKGNKSKVVINVNKLYFDILVIGSTGIQLYNSFEYKDTDDLIYYIMYIYDQLHLNPEDTDIVINGIIQKNSEAHTKLKRFVRNVYFEKNNDHYQFSYIFKEIPSGVLSNLINVYKCE